mgnify:CR=1 FL=1
MTDTARTYAELGTLFADNADGAISAQDLRDFVESWAQYGALHAKAGVTVQSSIGTSFVEVANWTANGQANGIAPDYTNHENVVGVTGCYSIAISMSFSGSSNTIFTSAPMINGTETAQGWASGKVGSGGDLITVSTCCMIPPSAGD